ncbi:uncharacterized protein LOC111385469 isoform X2 [Olea europaea var. sylvestris]|uniref:uncharacterized protein LOC111385469 isoform X2 n=1 Tax=Olea europaea var. sylvestris TaxID=158386 RepID=UPI000C1CE86F|nr:uncharacterized protein LOC111385469 isoform X2 [Olea europaea var. sylvestris]
MVGNSRFELTSASPESSFTGNYQIGQRGSYPSLVLDRSGSFREGAESRMFGSGKATSRGSAMLSGDLPALSQCLLLEPIVMIDQKCSRSSELRRVLGFSVGCSSEDYSFGAGHLKNSSPVAVDELKRLKASLADTRVKARAKKLDEHLNKLNKYFEGMTSKKLQRKEPSTNERSGSSNLKIGTQVNRSSLEVGNQKFEDRPKNVILNKRVRTSVAETRTECRGNGLPRQPLVASKDRDMLKDNNADSDMVEEKIRKLPAGGEGWEKGMKRKRSVGAAFSKPIGNDGEAKQNAHHKLANEHSLLSCDSSHGFRSGAPTGASSTSKLDSSSSPASSSARATLKNEPEKSVPSRDVSAGATKERVSGKGNIKLNTLEDNHAICPSPITKGKASRAPRTGSATSNNSASNVPRVSGTMESWEQPPGISKNPSFNGTSSRKRASPAGSSSPPLTQWAGQRPQKISRTRRTNPLSVSNHDEVQLQSEGCSPTEFGARLSSSGNDPPLLSENTANGIQIFNPKSGNVSSPARLSESDESGSGENGMEKKPIGSGYVDKKAASANKIVVKEEIGDGVWRQGQNGRVSPFSGASSSSMREKLDNPTPAKPLRNARSGCDKSGSKSGRTLKKLSDRKGVSRLGHVASGGSPDFNGEAEDDHEELLTAVNMACNSSFLACSSPFWKKFETLFTSISTDKKSYLLQELKLAEECGSPSQFSGHGNDVQVDVHEKKSAFDSLSGKRNQQMTIQTGTKDSSDMVEFIEQLQDSSLFGYRDTERRHNTVTPLYQRILSALIVEDEIEEFEENRFGGPSTIPVDSCLLIDTQSRYRDRLDFCETIFGVQTPKNGNSHIFFSCNGNADYDSSPNVRHHTRNGELLQGDSGYVHSEVEVLVRLSRCDYGPESLQSTNYSISSIDCQYEQMCLEDKLVLELQSVGLFLETVPALDDREDKVINQDIDQLERGLHQQIGKKKMFLDKICKAIEEGKDVDLRDPEQLAMDKLVELAYKKLLATRGSFATKHRIAKVSKQGALAFAKRTLDKCRKFEDSGVSCFAEPTLRDAIYAAPTQIAEGELLTSRDLVVANGCLSRFADGCLSDALETSSHLSDQTCAKIGPVLNRGKKKEVLLDHVGDAVFRATSTLGILGNAKGKRSERDPSTRNAVSRVSTGGLKGERKTKVKPKQKIAQLSTSGNGVTTRPVYVSASGSGELANIICNKKRDVRFMSSGNVPQDSSKDIKDSLELENLPLNDLDSMEELGVDTDIGAPQDFNTWFNFDVDGLQDHDSVGLEIPMDDLSELNMF